MVRKFVVILLLVTLLSMATPVHAITYGELDGNQHPNVGGLVASTAYSDGTWLPDELALQALDHQLSAIALTDHDSVEGCAQTAVACREQGIEFIPGVELTAEHCEIALEIEYRLSMTTEARAETMPPALAPIAEGVLQGQVAQIAAETCAIPSDWVDVLRPDTAEVPDSGPTVASRTTMIVGGLLATVNLTSRYAIKLYVDDQLQRTPWDVVVYQKSLPGLTLRLITVTRNVGVTSMGSICECC